MRCTITTKGWEEKVMRCMILRSFDSHPFTLKGGWGCLVISTVWNVWGVV